MTPRERTLTALFLAWSALVDGDLDADGLDDLLVADPYWDVDGYSGDLGAGLIILGH